jgi:DNA-binding transcriptional LysR family regulator
MIEPSAHLPFDLRSLEIFLAVCEQGAMAAAARRLSISQPAVSLAIAELERKMGTALFDRTVRPLALTPAGGMLRQRASILLADARQIAPLLRETKFGKLPTIRVGLVDSLTRVLAQPLAQFLSDRADQISMLSGLTATHASELLTRKLDIFLGVDDLVDLPGLERWTLLREPYVLMLPRGTPEIATVSDLKKCVRTLPLIRFSARSQTGMEIERHLRRLRLDLPRGIECDTPHAVAAMVSARAGFAITTPLCIHEAALPQRSFQIGRTPGAQISRTLTMIARQGELGTLPRELASMAQSILSATVEKIFKSTKDLKSR